MNLQTILMVCELIAVGPEVTVSNFNGSLRFSKFRILNYRNLKIH